MARAMKKFSAGGAQGRYDRRMKDIDKDRKIALAKGKNADVVEAKAAQRKADAEDDRAKRMGLDRTATRKAEYDAEQRLSRTRKFGADKPAAAAEPAKVSTPEPAKASEPAKAKPQSFGAAFKDARSRLGAGKTFTYNGKSFTTNIAGEGKSASRTETGTGTGTTAAASEPTKLNRNYKISPEQRKAIDAAAKKEPFTKTDSRAQADLKAMQARRNGAPASTTAKTVATTGGTALRGKPGGTPLFRFGKDIANDPARAAKLATLKKAAEAPGATQVAKDRYKDAASSGMYAKGGKIKEKGKTMKYAKGGSTPPKPSAADRARSKKHLDELKKLKPSAEEGKVVASANRSEGPGYKKGGKAKGKPFAATKFGAALMKKSADTKGRAMVKKAGGGKCYAKGGSIDGIAVKGKTKAKRVTMKKGGYC